MTLTTVIFDMDGLLIDSEPLWEEAGAETLQEFGIRLDHEQFLRTRGLRTREWLQFWFREFKVDPVHLDSSEASIVTHAIEKIKEKGQPMQGVDALFTLFAEQGFRMGLATSSPVALVKVVIEKLAIAGHLQALASAEHLPYGKPHPQVYLNCASELAVDPETCICFEDSFNGMIAAKAAKMKCVVVPDPLLYNEGRWGAADLKLPSLADFQVRHLKSLNR